MLINRNLGQWTLFRSASKVKSAALFSLLMSMIGIVASAQPINDNFTNATLITGSTGSVFGVNFTATREPGEPIHYTTGGRSVWYSWVAPDTGTATFDTFGSSFDTLLAAYTGTDLSNLVQVAANDDALNLQSRIAFSVAAGTNYFIAVDGYFGASGAYRLNWNLPQSTATNPPPNLGEVQLSASTYAVNEGPNSRITIAILYGGGAATDVTVDFETFDGTAIGGTDYSTTSGTRTFMPGDTIQTFDVEIKDNAIADGPRTFGVMLKNPTNANLNAYSSAIITIIDDETVPYVSTSGEFNFTATLYRVTENETIPFGPTEPNLWDVPGAVVTVNRLNGTTGKVLIDFSTIDPDDPTLTCFSTNRTGQAVPFCDYYPTFGTLEFLDGQTSTNFVLPVYSDFAIAPNGNKFVQLVLSNPRPAPEEDPNLIVPTLGLTNFAQVQILEVNTITNTFSIERATYAIQEFQPGFLVDVILPLGGGGSVQLSTIDSVSATAPYAFQLLDGSDYADPTTHNNPNPRYTDGTANIVNTADYNPTTVTINFPTTGPFFQQRRQRVFIPIVNDDTVEFNEDIRIFLHDPSQGKGIINGFANCTILYDDQPAGAADREWNPANVSFTTNAPFNQVPGANNGVQVVVVQQDQKSLIGGDFTAYNSAPRNRIARINRDGSTDLGFNPGTGANDFVSDIAVYNSGNSNNIGKIVAVGGFTSFNNIQRNGIARLMPNGALDTSFNPGAGANGPIRAVLLLGTGRIMVGGEFTTFNGVPRNGIARLNDDGSLDTGFDPGVGANGTVWALGVDSSSAAIQIGAGQSGSGVPEYRTNIDTRATSGTITIVFEPLFVPDTLHVYYDGVRIFDSGSVYQTNYPTPLIYVIPYGPGVSTVVTIVINEGSGDPGTSWTFSATIENAVVGERVYAGGEFTSFGGLPRSGIARLSANGPVDQGFDPGGGADAPIYSVKVQSDLKVLIGGAFTDIDFHARSRIARLNDDGSIDLSFDPGDGFDNSVYSIKLQNDGKAVIGGVFRSFDHTRRMGVARLFVNGVLDTSFMDTAYNQFAGLVRPFSFGPDNFVNCVALDSQGGVMIAGSFTNVGGNAYSYSNLVNFYFPPPTRQDIVPRFNIARLVGGYTPGPGNMQFSFPEYTADENAGSVAVTMERIDGRLGTIQIVDSTGDRLAQAGMDYIDTKESIVWPEWAYALGTRSVGYVGPNYFSVPIIDDTMIEGDELLNLFANDPSGSITLGGEYIPLGGARGRFAAPLNITDNDFNHGVIAFSSASYNVSENGGNVVVTLIRTNGSNGNVQVQLSTRDGTAQAGLDYTSRVATVTFQPGVTAVNVTIGIKDDTIVENQEYFFVVLTNVTGGATLPGGLPTSTEIATVNIIDNDVVAGRLNFSSTNYVANEGNTNFLVTVNRTGGNVGVLTVYAEVMEGTALLGRDFQIVTNSLFVSNRTYRLSWSSGDIAPKTFPLRILDDNEVNSNRYFSVRLFSPSVAAALQPPTNTIVNILDNDSFGTLEFSQANYDADENGTNVTITVVRKGGVAGTISVDYDIQPGGANPATPEVDYTTNGLNNPSSLIFGPGELSKTFRIGIIDDLVEGEGIETINLSLINPGGGATLGTLSNSVVSIIDDESSNIPAGSVDTTFDPMVGPDEPVYALALQSDGKLLIGGDFNTFSHITRHRIARLMDDGTLDASFNAGAGPNRPVRAIALDPDGKAVIGGFFTVIQGTNRNHIARLNRDGTVDNFFNPGAGADNPVYAVSLLPSGMVALGGSFTMFNGVPRQGVALLNTNGTLNLAFNPGLGANGAVYALAVQPDGKILIGGDFTRVDTTDIRGVARLNADGSVDPTFNPGAGADGPVRAILVQADGGMIVGGSFTSFDNSPRNYLVRLLGTGGVDQGFYADAGGDNAVYALAGQPDGKILVAGDFTSFNGVTRNRLTRLNPNGKTDPTINFGAGANAFITALLVQPDRKIVIGGGFTLVDNLVRNHVARLHGGSIAGSGRIQFAAPDFVAYEGDGSATMVLRRQGGTTGEASVDVMVLPPSGPSSAQPGSDYFDTNTIHTITFAEGETYQEFHLQVLDDTLVEDPETVDLMLVDTIGNGGVLGDQPFATLTIVSDDSLIRFLTPTFTVSENVLSGIAPITVLRTGATNTTVSVDYRTFDGTAHAPDDYTSVADTLTFAPGEVAKTFSVPIRDDSLVEGPETVLLILTNATGGTGISIPQAVLTIVDDELAPGMFNFSSAAYTVNEYETNITITIVRTNGSSGFVSVDYTTRDGSARAGQDYITRSGSISFADGEMVKTFNVPIIPDYINPESDETFLLILSKPTSGATLGAISTATVTIINNPLVNGSISLAQTNYSTIESNGSVTLTINRTLGFQGNVDVTYRTVPGTALEGSDFVPVTNTVSWTDGDSSAKTITITLVNDTVVEQPEDFQVVIENPTGGASLGGRTSAVVTILDDDKAAGYLGFQFANYIVSENGTNAVISVARTLGDTGTVSIAYATVPGGTAQANANYTNVSGTLTFLPGETNKTFTVPIVDNFVVDVDKTVNLELSNPSGGALTNGQIVAAVLTIVENDQPAGTLDVSFNNQGANAQIYSLLLHTNNKIYVAGDFTDFSGSTRIRLARLNLNGAVDPSFDPGNNLNNSVRALGLQSDNKIIAGGLFASTSSTGLSYLIRFNTDGMRDTNFFAGLRGVDNAVYAVAVQTDQKVLIGGIFNNVNGTNRQFLARITSTGALDPAFVSEARADGPVRSILVQSDGRILIAGDFNTVNGSPCARIARLLTDGRLDTTFTAQPGANSSVYALALQADGKILAGGTFTNYAGLSMGRVVRLLPNGQVDSTFNVSGSGANEFVTAITLQPDGKILVAGGFTEYNDITRNRLVRLAPDGSLDTTINFGDGANSYISAVLVQPDRKIVIGGAFTTFDNVPRNYIARLNGGDNLGYGGFVFSATNYNIVEGSNVTITVKRLIGTSNTVTLDYTTTATGTAVPFQNFIPTNGTLTFLPGETSKSFDITTIDDTVTNADRTIGLALSNPSNGGTLGVPNVATVTIQNDDGVIAFSTANYSVSENGGVAMVTVERQGSSVGIATVQYSTGGGTATATADYAPVAGTLTFTNGQVQQDIIVPIIDDALAEGNETVFLSLTNASQNYTLGLSMATLTIVDNELDSGTLQFATNNFVVSEQSFLGAAIVTVIRAGGSIGSASVEYSTSDGSATAPADYLTTRGTLVFADGEGTKTFRVPIVDDMLVEGAETINLTLANATGAALGPNTATITIAGDEAIFSFTNQFFVNEGDPYAQIIVNRSAAGSGPVSVQVNTFDGTAIAGLDYVSVNTNLNWNPGDISPKIVYVPIIDDAFGEVDETFSVELINPTGESQIDPNSQTATVFIRDNDSSFAFDSANYFFDETIGTGSVRVVRLGLTNLAATVEFSTQDGTATAGRGDYFPVSGTLNFAPNESSKIINIQIIDDAVNNGNRDFSVVLRNPINANLSSPSLSTITIVDDERQRAGSIAGQFNFSTNLYMVTEFEGDTLSPNSTLITRTTSGCITTSNRLDFSANYRDVLGAVITVNRTGGAQGRVMVDYDTIDLVDPFCGLGIILGTGVTNAFADCNYAPTHGTLVFDHLQTSTNFVIPIYSQGFFLFAATNFLFFQDRFLTVVLSNPRVYTNSNPALSENPELLVPTIGPGATSTVDIVQLEVTGEFNFARASHRIDERDNGQPCPFVRNARELWVPIYLPGGGGGSVRFRARQNFTMRPGPFIQQQIGLEAGSDNALQAQSVYPNPLFTDGSPIVTNAQDFVFVDTTINIPRGFTTTWARVPILDDDEVEFNEDIYLELIPLPNNPPTGYMDVSRATILFDDQPAGAADREWNPANVTNSVPPLYTTPGANNIVHAVAVQDDQKTIIGGEFTAYNSISRLGVARIDSNGFNDPTFNPGVGANNSVNSIAIYRAGMGSSNNLGKIVLGGSFNSFDAQLRNRVARLNPDGSIDQTFLPGDGGDAAVDSVAIQLDGKVIVAGEFTTFNGYPRNGVARLNEDGSVDLTFDPGSGANATVWAVGLSDDGTNGQKVVVGGEFSIFNGFVRSGIARLNEDGSVDTTFDPGGGADGPVYALAVQNDNKVIIGGFFTDVDFQSRNSIARLNATGDIDSSFDPGDGADSAVYSIVLQPDGKPMIGGVFTAYNQTRRLGLARLLTSGVLDTSFLDTAYNQFAGLINGVSFLPPNFVRSIAFETNGNVMIGGSFTNLGGNFAEQLNSYPSFTNVWTRQQKVTRFNVARLIGGYTPGPGNVEVASPLYTIDENSGFLALTLRRVDGRLGSAAQTFVTGDRLAQAGFDYGYASSNAFWAQQGYVDIFGFPLVPTSVGFVGASYFQVPILDDTLIEGDEILNVTGLRPNGTITLGSEIIPIGAARGRSSATVTIIDNDFPHGQLDFSSPSFVIGENNSTATITVLRTNGSNGSVSVDYFTRDGTATNGQDYVATSGTLTFGPGVTAQSFNITIINDSLVEPLDESVLLILTNATGGATLPGGTSTSFAASMLSIIDDDFPSGYLNFATTNFVVNEGSGFAPVTVTRRGGVSGTLTVQVRATPGTASDPADFTGGTTTLSWTNGDSSPKTFNLPIVDDSVIEPNETINLTLQNPSVAGSIGATNTAIVTIVDNDNYGTLEFSKANYEAEENGTNVTITIIRHDGQAGEVRVEVVVSNITATVNQDYTTNLVPRGQIIFGPGVTTRTFSIGLINDSIAEGLETIGLALQNPVNAVLGYTSNALVSIIDDEDSNIPAGSPDTTFDVGFGPNSAVYNLALQKDGNILIGGEFTQVDRETRNRLARLLPDGSLDPNYNVGPGVNRPIRALALQEDGKALVGGLFTRVQGTNFNHIARLNTDGSLDIFFNPGAGADNTVYAVSVLPDRRIVVGGSFTTFNGASRPGIAVLNTNGSLYLPFNPGVGFNGIVFALAAQIDGKIIVGGDFTTVNNVTQPRLARLNPNGSVDTSFNPGLGANAAVRAVLIQPDGRILVGGSFTNINGTTRNYLARLNADGSLDTNFLANATQGANDSVYALALQFDGKILVGGDFTRFSGVTRHRITRLNADGQVDPTINFGGGANGAVAAIALQEDRKIVLGGAFTRFNDQPSFYVARLYGGSLAGPGAFTFSSATYNVDEFAGQAIITVRRTGGTRGAAQIDYATVNGTATAGVDYLPRSGSFTFPEAEVEQTFSVPILQDVEVEDVETVGLRLSNPSLGARLGLQPTATLNIFSDDSQIGFVASAFSISESAQSGHATINVVRSGATNTSVSVDILVQDGTATAGLDYLKPTVTKLTYAPGETLKTFQIPILPDTNVEGNETVLLTLTNAVSNGGLDSAIYYSIGSAVLTIVDDDFAFGILNFSQAVYGVRESESNRVITVVRTNGSDGIVSVDYTSRDGTALAGLDYVAVSGTLTFADGELSKTFDVPVVFDFVDEGEESLSLSLSNVRGGATLGLTNATLIITNTEATEGIKIVTAGAALLQESGPVNGLLDSGETVTFNLGLRNNGILDARNVVATLLSTNGIAAITTSATYGSILAGGATVSRPFQFRVTGSNGTRVTATLKLQDGTLNLGLLGFDMFVGQAAFTFYNTNAIIINDRAPATPYPSAIPISGLNGTLAKISVTLSNVAHSFPDDMDILLVNPQGNSVVLLSDAGSNGGANPNSITNVTLTFEDDVGRFLSDTGPIVSGTYQPTNYGAATAVDFWPVPAPSNAPSGIRLLTSPPPDPNGVWQLFVVDDASQDTGIIVNGWSVTLSLSGSGTTAGDLDIAAVASPNQITAGQTVNYNLSVTNHGPARATGILLSNILDPAMTFVSCQGGTCTTNGNVVLISLPGNLASDAGANVVLTVRANPANPAVTNTLFNMAMVKGNETDLNPANNAASSKVIVYPYPTVSLQQKDAQTIVLSWPASGAGSYFVEGTATLVPSNWQRVTNTVSTSGGVMSVTINTSTDSTRFFRLHSP